MSHELSSLTPKSSSSRLMVPPSIRPSRSLSNLHIQNQAMDSPTPLQSSNSTLDSTESSVINLDLNEGILLQDADVETEEVDEVTIMPLDSDIQKGDENSKMKLRDQLRKTLNHTIPRSDSTVLHSTLSGNVMEVQDTTVGTISRYPPRQYFVFTDAGKPVYVSPSGMEDPSNVTATIGVMQALISVFLDDSDKLRCINAGRSRITFLLRPPLYYACVSSWGEPESVTRSHMEYLHLQVLSIVTAAQLRRIFERRTNFDLRRLLDGTEGFLTSLLERLEFDLAISTSSLQCLKLDPSTRKRIAEALLPPSKVKDILYAMLVAEGKVITLIRPRKHSIHPADIHIVLNTIHSPSVFNSPASSSWIPMCLPKFNPSGFVNTYISFLGRDPSDSIETRTSDIHSLLDPEVTPQLSRATRINTQFKPHLTLVCISGGTEFESIRTWCDAVTTRLDKDGLLTAIHNACSSGKTNYSVGDLGVPGLRHFVYKYRSQVQVTAPIFEEPYDNIEDRKRLITLYQKLYDAIHAKSSQDGPLKLQYIRTSKESVMGWITQPFELYIALSPHLPKTAVVGAANAVARWVKKEEAKLFLRDAPVF